VNSTFTLLQLFKLGGVFMWPLLVFSIVAVAIVLERTVYMLGRDKKVTPHYDAVAPLVKKGDFRKAFRYLDNLPDNCLVRPVFTKLLESADLDEHQIERGVELTAQAVIADMENGFNFLPAIGSIAPLTGFLGTVSGMIGAFRSIAQASEVNAQIVANGIYEALITTVFGLIIAIVAMVAHSILTSVVDKFALETEQTAGDLIAEITEGGR
jgi:biopolymer transport protein ExbB